MSEADRYDVLILGSGTGGKIMAWTMAGEGKRTAVVERKFVGGSCPNIACLPSKNVIHSAKVASLFRRHEEFGIGTGQISVDMAGVYRRKRKMVDDLVALHLSLYRASGAELIFGDGCFAGPRTLEVALRDGGKRTLTAERIFVNVGTRASIPAIPGLMEARPLTHIEALDLERLPEHLIVLGGGYVGLELSQAMHRFGSRVTLITRGQLAAREDPDVSEAVLQLFREEGIDVLLNTEVRAVHGVSGEHVRVEVGGQGGVRMVEGTDLLAALGRTPNTKGIGLERAGIAVNPAGHIQVNERLETTAENVWAIGECAGSPYFTHVSFDDFRIIHANLNGGNRSTRDRLIPYCVFLDPPLARVGLSETEAQAAKLAYRVASMPMAEVLKTRTLSEPRGFMKALIDARNDRILGFTAFGPEAGELMGTIQVAMLAGQSYTALRDAVFTHPTMSEGFNFLFSNVPSA
jgi:pyruvate/2-oxoglutarate dehydrogenase complex dihydrolipoamide dehydrogenase (E3) component